MNAVERIDRAVEATGLAGLHAAIEAADAERARLAAEGNVDALAHGLADHPMTTTTESNLVLHAKRELELLGQTAEDPTFAESLVNAVRAFAEYGHSGGSAAAGVAMLSALLRFEALSPLTTEAAEWTDVAEQSGVPLWQSKRDPSAFCEGRAPGDPEAIFYRLGGETGRIRLVLNDDGLLIATP